jgi:hypothetical protein
MVRGILASGCALVAVGWATVALAADGVPEGVTALGQSHKQTNTFALLDAATGAKLQDFCVTREGLVVALVAKAAPIGALGEDADVKSSGQSQVRVLDRDGKVVREWTVDFVAAAIGAAPDGAVYVAGNGQVASYDPQGKLLQRGDAPQTAGLNTDDLRESAQEQLDAEKEAAAEQIKQFEAIVKDPKQVEARQ